MRGPNPTPTHHVSCPPGTHLRDGECFNNGNAETANPPPDASPSCAPGIHLRAGECLNNPQVTRGNND